ncbi:DNA internalization-related competence protein ComEC/Rec2 [Sedimentibacter sp. zth1]|uniref:DNA internalization-related competence protein ComEC/Rec2 n=1 Tax=Sedimentibacter sp. zth1 TaxID=2816908 RepID=UPI001A92DF8E|nr:DNA internalization-related competence protein ComEC/Rec2 [Sedimentibacter sp. zth1]QSX07097.1 DNA internalization-related competence protein ComEC/Rec2 [Sedimentibacter sp. zth1]
MYYFVIYFVAYVLSIIVCLYLNYKTAIILSLIFFALGIVTTKKYVACFLIILFAVLSVVCINYNSKSILTQYLNDDVNVIVEIKNVIKDDKESEFISYNVNVICLNGKNIHEKSILYIKKENKIEINSIHKINVSVSKIQESKNFLLFNYKKSLRTKKIFVNLFANTKPNLIKKDYSKVNTIVNNFKGFVEKLFYSNLNEKNANIILSILLGDKKYLDDDLYKSIQRTGLAHIFAVSGLHIGILYGFLIKLFCMIGFNKKISWFLTWGFLWCYGFLIGFPVSVLRSLIMFTFVFGAELLYRKYNTINSIVIAAFILLVVNPFYLFDVGFQLSFTAAFCLIIFNKYVKDKLKSKNTIISSIYLYIFLQLFTLPIMSYYFNYLSLLGILYNIALVPIFSVLIVIAFISVGVGFLCVYTLVLPLKIYDYVFNVIRYVIDWGSKSSIAGVKIPSMRLLTCFFYYVFLALILFIINNKKCSYKRILFATFIVYYCINFFIIPLSLDGTRLNIVDVSQGVFIILRHNDINLIFDAGSNSDNIGKYVCAPYILKNGFNDIKSIFISHWHIDHYSGVNEILSSSKVGNVYSSSEDDKNLINCHCNLLNNTDSIIIDNEFKIDILWPKIGFKSNNENNMSNVYLVKCGKIKILITGDIEKEAERQILDRLEDINVLIVPHHGSKTSSTTEFVQAVNPDIAVFSYGKNNYGIPHQEVIDKYNDIGSDILSTFTNGEINIMEINDEIYYNTYKGNHSENMNEIYKLYFLLNLYIFVILLVYVMFYKNYILDKRYEGKYEL